MKNQIFNKVAAGLVRFAPMSESDLSAFAGVSNFKNGDRPQIASLDVGETEWVFIASGEALVVHWLDGDEQNHEVVFYHGLNCSHKSVRLFRALLSVAADPGDLVDLGFADVC